MWIDASVASCDVVIDKRLSLVAATPGAPRFEQGLHVRGVPAGQTVVISGVLGIGATNSADTTLTGPRSLTIVDASIP